MLVEANFINPSATPWDYGFFIRDSLDGWHALIVDSNLRWYHYVQTGTVESRTPLREGTIPDLNITPVGGNQLRLIAVGDVGWFFAKGSFVTKLDLGDVVSAGDIFALTGFFIGDESAGDSTGFSDFSVWSLE